MGPFLRKLFPGSGRISLLQWLGACGDRSRLGHFSAFPHAPGWCLSLVRDPSLPFFPVFFHFFLSVDTY